MKGGFHSGLKLCTGSSVARQEYFVLTKMSSSFASTVRIDVAGRVRHARDVEALVIGKRPKL